MSSKETDQFKPLYRQWRDDILLQAWESASGRYRMELWKIELDAKLTRKVRFFVNGESVYSTWNITSLEAAKVIGKALRHTSGKGIAMINYRPVDVPEEYTRPWKSSDGRWGKV